MEQDTGLANAISKKMHGRKARRYLALALYLIVLAAFFGEAGYLLSRSIAPRAAAAPAAPAR